MLDNMLDMLVMLVILDNMLSLSYPWPEILSCDKFNWYTEHDPNEPASISKVCAGNPKYTKENFYKLFPEVVNGTYQHYDPDKVGLFVRLYVGSCVCLFDSVFFVCLLVGLFPRHTLPIRTPKLVL